MSYTVGGVTFDMMKVPAGHYTMGLSADNRRKVTNGIAQEVALDGFVVSELPVSQALWTAVTGKNPSTKPDPQAPVDRISWVEAQKFLRKLGKLTGKTFFLPTEAQWEYAQKACGGKNFTAVSEWCEDSWSAVSKGETRNEYFHPMTLMVNPRGPEVTSTKVVRTVLERLGTESHTRKSFLGFRLVQPTGDTLSAAILGPLEGHSIDREEIDASDGSPETFEVDGVSFRMVKVRGGKFTMGFTDADAPGAAFEIPRNELPAHEVSLDDYAIGETEVTTGLWKVVMGTLPYLNGADRLQEPVGNVSWYDCQAFLRKLNARTGRKFRLPTEAEWEYAARGGMKSRHTPFSGSSYVRVVAVYTSTAGDAPAKPAKENVKSLRPNELGLYDMSGNVWEWCYDRSSDYPEGPLANPLGASEGGTRIMRGGSYASPWTACRVTNRSFIPAKNVKGSFGLRLAL